MTRFLPFVVSALVVCTFQLEVRADQRRPTKLTLKQLRDKVHSSKARWVGKQLEVKGLTSAVNSSTSSEKTVVRVKMNLADGSFELTCRMVSNEPMPLPHIQFGTPITFVGALRASGDELDECTYAVGKK
jgi:hypothetical protein